MSIRPIDYTTLVSKSQEIAKIKEAENNRFEIQVEQGIQQQNKQIERNIKKVRDTNKSENLTIDVNKKKKDRQNNDKKNQENEKKKDQVKIKYNIGSNIDIKI